ncbi:MAG TPA: RNA polymerase sigma factor [Rhizomicrobium sp.]|nr:RNA polymerase sigma factor [Rhizomicrobium sp.]
MIETPGNNFDDAEQRGSGVAITASELRDWFVREVLPLEADLMHYMLSIWRNRNEIADLRQDVYVRVLEGARKQLPKPAKPFVFATARNLLIDRVRRARIVPIDAVADLEAFAIASDSPAPDRSIIARDELRRLQVAIDHLPPRCREAVILGRIDGLTGQEIAARMGISEATVSKHLATGMFALANVLYGKRSEKGP